jgi:hypothetical protein
MTPIRQFSALLIVFATGWLLCTRSAIAQQSVMVTQAAATRQPMAPLPPPELIVPPSPRPGLALADLEHIALSSNPSFGALCITSFQQCGDCHRPIGPKQVKPRKKSDHL